MQTCKKIAKPPKPPRRTAQKKPVNKLKDTAPKPDNTARRLSKKRDGQSNNVAVVPSKAVVTEIFRPSAMPLPETEIANSQPKYYTNFDFYYKRTSFRTMALFFKTAFNPFLDMWKSAKKTKPVEAFLQEYTSTQFPGLLENMPSEAVQSTFLELVKLLLFSHRHNKNDAYLRDPLVPFALVRGPLYKYSK